MIAWRFIVPRKRYFELIRIGKFFPEITKHIDRDAYLVLKEAVLCIPYIIISVVLIPFVLLGEIPKLVAAILPSLPDYSGERAKNSAAANEIAPIKEIQRRMRETH